jgi:hypothetical protein
VGRGTKQERQNHRAIDEVAKGLKRNDAERAVSALLKLEDNSREPYLTGTAALFRAEVHKSFVGGHWSRLVFWAVRAEREPRLLNAGATAQQQTDTRWELLCGCLRSCEWGRARKYFESLRSALGDAPATTTLDQYIASAGSPTVQVIVPLMKSTPPVDARLGYDPGQYRHRAEPLPVTEPAVPEQVEDQLLQLYSSSAFGVFSSAIEQWARKAPPPVASRIWVVAVQLATGELLSRIQEKRGRLHEPALVIANGCLKNGAPPEMGGELVLALRALCARLISAGSNPRSEELRAVISLCDAALLYPALAPMVGHVAATIDFPPEAHKAFLEWVARLLDREPTAALWFRAFDLSLLADAVEPPPWLVASLSQLLDRDEVKTYLRAQQENREAVRRLILVAEYLPVSLAERILDQAWQAVDETHKSFLIEAYERLLANARGEARLDHPVDDFDPNDLIDFALRMGIADEEEADLVRRELARSPLGKKIAQKMAARCLDEDDPDDELPPCVIPLWNRIKSRVIPHRIDFLEVALANATSGQEMRDATQQFLHLRPSIRAALHILAHEDPDEYPLALDSIEEELFTKYMLDAEALAVGLLAAKEFKLSRKLRAKLAKAFRDALERRPVSPPYSPSITAALIEADKMTPRRKPASTGKKRSAKVSRATAKVSRQDPDTGPKQINFNHMFND